jgi:hypothetical protein
MAGAELALVELAELAELALVRAELAAGVALACARAYCLARSGRRPNSLTTPEADHMTERENAKARARLSKELDRDLFRKGREKLAELRKHIQHAKGWRRTRLPEVRIACKRNRVIAVERARAARAAIAAEAKIAKHTATQEIRLAARNACEARKSTAELRGLDAVTRAQHKLHEEARYLRDIKRGMTKPKLAPGQARKRAAERLAESDDEVRNNTDPELWPVWEAMKGKIKATPRATRTEVFAQWAHDHPADVERIMYADHDESIKDLIKAEAAQRAHLAQPAAKRARRSRRERAELAEAFEPAAEVEPWDEPAAEVEPWDERAELAKLAQAERDERAELAAGMPATTDWDEQQAEAEAGIYEADASPLLLFFPSSAQQYQFLDDASAHRGRRGMDQRAAESHLHNSRWLLWTPPYDAADRKAWSVALAKAAGVAVDPAWEVPATLAKILELPHAHRLAPLRAVGLTEHAPEVGWPEAGRPLPAKYASDTDALYEQLEARHKSIGQATERASRAAYVARTPKRKLEKEQRAAAAEAKREEAKYQKQRAAERRQDIRDAAAAERAHKAAQKAERAAELKEAKRRKKGGRAYQVRETLAEPGSPRDRIQQAKRAEAERYKAQDIAEGEAAANAWIKDHAGHIAIGDAPKGNPPAFYLGWRARVITYKAELAASRPAKRRNIPQGWTASELAAKREAKKFARMDQDMEAQADRYRESRAEQAAAITKAQAAERYQQSRAELAAELGDEVEYQGPSSAETYRHAAPRNWFDPAEGAPDVRLTFSSPAGLDDFRRIARETRDQHQTWLGFDRMAPGMRAIGSREAIWSLPGADELAHGDGYGRTFAGVLASHGGRITQQFDPYWEPPADTYQAPKFTEAEIEEMSRQEEADIGRKMRRAARAGTL